MREGPRPAAAVIDLDLPGMNGLQLIELLRQSDPDLVPVLVTATSESALSESQVRPAAFLQKPLNFDRLIGVLESRTGV